MPSDGGIGDGLPRRGRDERLIGEPDDHEVAAERRPAADSASCSEPACPCCHFGLCDRDDARFVDVEGDRAGDDDDMIESGRE